MKTIFILILLLPFLSMAQVEKFGTVSTKKVESYNANLTIKANNNKVVEDALSGIDWLIGGATKMQLDTSGRVGIGVVPSTTLHVASSGVFTANIAGANAGTGIGSSGILIITNTDATVGNTTGMIFRNSAGGNAVGIEAINVNQSGSATGNLVFATNNAGAYAERMRVTSGGSVGVGLTPSAKMHIGTGTGFGNGYRVSGSNDNAEFYIEADNTGAIDVRLDGGSSGGNLKLNPSGGVVQSTGIFNNTTASAANVFIDASGNLQRSTSSIRYKNSVKNYSRGLAEVRKLRPVFYKGNNDGNRIYAGFIAEEIDALGLKEFVIYNNKNQPDALAYANMTALLTKSIQDLDAKNQLLNKQVQALTALVCLDHPESELCYQ